MPQMHGMWILWLIFWVLVIAGLILIVRALTSRKGGAIDVLNKRYARGEIEKEEYERKKKDILGG